MAHPRSASTDLPQARARGSIVASLAGVLVCGGGASLLAWAIVTALGLEGPVAGVAAAAIAMVAAMALWTAGVALLRAFPRSRPR